MAHLLPFRVSTACFLTVALLLSGCCANNVCNCQDEQADAIKLRFSPRFATADLDTIIIQRSPLPYSPTTKPETVTLVRTAARVRDSVVINNTTPFAQAGTAKLNKYRYVVQYLGQAPQSKPVPTTVLVIDSIRLAGSLDGNGCCTCYTNTQKTVYATRPKRNSAAADSAFVIDLKQKPYIELVK
ncbi:hypothetical protein [Hymenobacter sedentarius]|uniref:hypothetical protein n=1 Tax=Hymenobacter sedentarius TaxID=1411621 RepID=UPI000AC0D956|nr:hypothetical protein [Hymenobacter sedentarius]